MDTWASINHSMSYTEGRCPVILGIKNKKMYNTIITNNRIHVIRLVADRGKYSTGQVVPMPNYLGTGMALCGVVAKGETLEDWIIKNHK